ncbi:hypothetical protein EWM64_g654 [Hericium alpestre]|uniref:NAD(P)-binding protein n=1 Tax=Hericium alpestre TaxID=135208 RepID=A0A4Z0ABI6_9AGAM|nr:hypothetical protein EWM64_g654 [Hericium alpestre]
MERWAALIEWHTLDLPLFGSEIKCLAKVVIGDRDAKGAEDVVTEISQTRGVATFAPCDVLNWDSQVNLFELAIKQYGSVDIVFPCAGVTELNPICDGNVELKDGRPVPPNLRTLDINLTAVLHTVHLALYYFKKNRGEGDWKALILIGSMASWQAIPGGPQYSASKHAILGLMRSLWPVVSQDNIRISVIHPWYTDTAIIVPELKVLLAGIPLTPIARVAGAVFRSATDPDPATSGLPWVLPDDGPVLLLPREVLNTGVYGMVNRRVERIKSFAESCKLVASTTRDLWSIFGQGITFAATLGSIAYFVFKKSNALAI